MKIIITAEKKRFTIPLPYFLLPVIRRILCSKWFWKKINSRVTNITFPIPLLDKQTVQPILTPLKEYKGLTLVEVQDKDGNGLVIRL